MTVQVCFKDVVITGSYQLCFRGISGVFKWVYGSFMGISAVVYGGILSLYILFKSLLYSYFCKKKNNLNFLAKIKEWRKKKEKEKYY